MPSKRKSTANPNLYTLNDSDYKRQENNQQLLSQQSQENSSYSSMLSSSTNRDQSQQLKKDHMKLQEELKNYKLQNQQLKDLNDLAEERNHKHQEKQHQLIKRLSYLDVTNKQLNYEVQKLANNWLKEQQHYVNYHTNITANSNPNLENKRINRKFNEEKLSFLQILKAMLQMLKQCNYKDYKVEHQNIVGLIEKNITASNKDVDLDIKFEIARMETLKQQCSKQEQQIQSLQQALQEEKNTKQKIVINYNQKINKLRNMYENLKQQIKQQQNTDHVKIKQMEERKDQIINELKYKIKEVKRKKQSSENRYQPSKKYDSRRRNTASKPQRKSYIGGDYENYKLDQLDQAIEELEKQIIQELPQ